MKILYVFDGGQEELQHHVLYELREKGHSVHTVLAQMPGYFAWKDMLEPDFLKKFEGETYDLGVSNTHSGNPNFRKFQEIIKPKLGWVDLEHDLFSDAAEISKSSRGVVCLTKKHYETAKRKGYRAVMARPYSADTFYEPLELPDSVPLETAIVVQERDHTPKDRVEAAAKNFFKQFFLKKFSDALPTPPGYIAPDQFYGPAGNRYAAEVGKFWLVYESGAYVDALLWGCIPLIQSMNRTCIFTREATEFPYDKIAILKTTTGDKVTLNRGITLENVEDKLAYIRENYDKVHRELTEEWFDLDNFGDLPSTGQAILKLMKAK